MEDRFSGHLTGCGIRSRHDFACTCGGPWSPPARARMELGTAGFRGHDDGDYNAPCDACGRPLVTDPDQIICDECRATDPTRDPVNFTENIR